MIRKIRPAGLRTNLLLGGVAWLVGCSTDRPETMAPIYEEKLPDIVGNAAPIESSKGAWRPASNGPTLVDLLREGGRRTTPPFARVAENPENEDFPLPRRRPSSWANIPDDAITGVSSPPRTAAIEVSILLPVRAPWQETPKLPPITSPPPQVSLRKPVAEEGSSALFAEDAPLPDDAEEDARDPDRTVLAAIIDSVNRAGPGADHPKRGRSLTPGTVEEATFSGPKPKLVAEIGRYDQEISALLGWSYLSMQHPEQFGDRSVMLETQPSGPDAENLDPSAKEESFEEEGEFALVVEIRNRRAGEAFCRAMAGRGQACLVRERSGSVRTPPPPPPRQIAQRNE